MYIVLFPEPKFLRIMVTLVENLPGSGHCAAVSASINSFNLPKSTTFCSRYCSYPTFINEETETPRGCLNLSKVTPFMSKLTQAI